jgi:class 3 adenylate cyclase/predicted ATPase
LDIAAWLEGLGLGTHAELFRAHAIDAEVLADLTEADLEKLGLPLGHRKKLLRAIAGLAPPPPHPAPPRAAERRQLTVMLVDLVGSTALSARLDPEELAELLKVYQNTVTGEITRFEGHVAKLMGDGVLAYFGWPRAHEDEAERAVRAGLAIVEAVARIEGGGAPLACRVGIATGLVVVGDLVGEGSAQEEAVVGETPNLAARLQGLAPPGNIVIAESTRHLLGDLFLLRALGLQTLKGVPSPLPAFVILRERAVESRFAARQSGGIAPLVGRDQELALLVERRRQAGAGEGQLVLLTGEAGIGKSRIVEALVGTGGDEPHVRVRYQCSPYHADSALYPTIQHLTRASGIRAEDPVDARLDKLEALLGPAARGAPPALALLAALLGLDATARYGELQLTPQERRNRTLACLLDQLLALAKQSPVLWVIEDAHWIDPTTQELIELALDRIAAARVLVLVTARPTFTHGFGGHPIVTRLTLNRLGHEQTAAIVTRITGGKPIPEALLAEIAARTDGVPLFVEEMTKAVLESGVLRETPAAFELAGPLSALAIPTTLHDSLMARLDRLHPVKEVAQTAAVIGRTFDHQTIAALTDLPETELDMAMRRLVEAELVFRRGTPPDATYLFKHALVRDAAYESLLKSRRAALHGRLVEVLERNGEAAPEVKAQHAEAAGMVDRALDYWELAGARALSRPAYQEAIASLENGVRLCRSLGDGPRWRQRELALLLQQGQALIAREGYQAAGTLRAFESALELAEQTGDPSSQLPALYGQWAARYIGCTGSAEIASRYAAIAAIRPDSGPRLVGLRMLALEAFHQGRFSESLSLARQSLALYDPAAHADLRHRFAHDPRTASSGYVAWNLWHLGYPDQAMRAIDDTLAWTRAIDHTNTTCFALIFAIGVPLVWLQRFDRVEETARETLRIAAEMSLALWQAWSRVHVGLAIAQQDPAAGVEEIEAGLAEATRIGASRFLDTLHRGQLADIRSRQGRHAQAKADIDVAFAAAERSGDAASTAELHRIRAATALRAEASAAPPAEADLLRALEIARAQSAKSLELRAARDLARLWAERGERRKAHALLAPVYAWFTEGHDTPDLIEARALLDQLA